VVETAVSGVQALNKALLLSPDAIVLDIMLPEMDGWETLRRLKRRMRTEKIPVVVVSGHEWPAERIEASACDLYLQKPCAPHELLARIRWLLSGQR
jgi:DNA-binding response OmpR family regulator